MESQADGWRYARAARLITAVVFFAAAVLEIALAKWVSAVLYFVCGAFFLLGERLDRLPKAARYILLAVFAAFCVAVFVKLILDAQALR